MLAQLLQQQQQQFTSFQPNKLPDPATPNPLPSASAPIPIPNAATGIPPPEQTGDPGGSSGTGRFDSNLGCVTRARMRSWNQNRGDRDPLVATMRFGQQQQQQQPTQPLPTGPLKADMGKMHQQMHTPAAHSWATARDHSRPENLVSTGWMSVVYLVTENLCVGFILIHFRALCRHGGNAFDVISLQQGEIGIDNYFE